MTDLIQFSTIDGFVPGRRYRQGSIRLGGACVFEGAVSPNNGFPLTQHVLLEADVRCVRDAGWKGPMPLLYAWKCAIHLEDFTYQVLDGRLKLLAYGQGPVDVDDFPYPGYPVVFKEQRFEACEVPLSEAAQWSTLNAMTLRDERVDPDSPLWDLAKPRHQFGGAPYLLNPADVEAICPLCSRAMPIFATVADESGTLAQPFFGNEYVQLVYFLCAACRVLTARNLTG